MSGCARWLLIVAAALVCGGCITRKVVVDPALETELNDTSWRPVAPLEETDR